MTPHLPTTWCHKTSTQLKKPSPNNPEEVSQFADESNKATDQFTQTIHQYEPYSIKDAYSDFVGTYFKKNIMQPHPVMNWLEALPGFRKFEVGEQFTIAKLFRHLQRVHNASAEMVGHLAFLARTLQPNQFEFILKLGWCPLVQFNTPPHLCNPGELHFARRDLTPDKLFDQRVVNTILPHPYHPNLDNVGSKHTTRCLVVAVHYTPRDKLFTKSQNHKIMWQICLWLNVKSFSHPSWAELTTQERSWPSRTKRKGDERT